MGEVEGTKVLPIPVEPGDEPTGLIIISGSEDKVKGLRDYNPRLDLPLMVLIDEAEVPQFFFPLNGMAMTEEFESDLISLNSVSK